jgi:hypothetical protein
MRAPTLTRALIGVARRTKVLVEECIVKAVRLHGKMLDRVVRREEEVLVEFEDRTKIMQRAYLFAMNEETTQYFRTSNVRRAAEAEKQELGLL